MWWEFHKSLSNLVIFPTNQLGSTLTASLIAPFNQSNVISSKWLSKSIKPWYVLRLINSDVTESDVSPPTSCLHVKNEREVNYYNNLQPTYRLLSPDFAQNPRPCYNIKITQLIGFVINWLVSNLWVHWSYRSSCPEVFCKKKCS